MFNTDIPSRKLYSRMICDKCRQAQPYLQNIKRNDLSLGQSANLAGNFPLDPGLGINYNQQVWM